MTDPDPVLTITGTVGTQECVLARVEIDAGGRDPSQVVADMLRQLTAKVEGQDPGRPAHDRGPSVGDIVHYVSYGTPAGEYSRACRAAIITKVRGRAVNTATGSDVKEHMVDLAVLNPTGMHFTTHRVQMEDARDGGTWHWPEQTGSWGHLPPLPE